MILPLYFVLSFLLFNTYIIAQNAGDPQELYRFPNGTRIENLLVLRNGSLLLTLLTEPSLYLFDPKSPETALLVHHFPHQTSLLGITQLDQKTVAVIAGNLIDSTYENTTGVPGSFSVFLLELSGRIVTRYPIRKASFLASITALPGTPYLLMSDPTLAVVWRLNILTGAVDKPIADSLLVTNPGDAGPPLNPNQLDGGAGPSLNGIHVVGQYLYFSNTTQGLLARIRIKPDGTPVGAPPETRSYGFDYYRFGGFTVAPDNTIFVTDPIGNTVAQLSPVGVVPLLITIPICGEGIDHPTAVAFASTSVNEKILYIVTAGFLPGYGGTGGGQVLKVRLSPTAGFCGVGFF